VFRMIIKVCERALLNQSDLINTDLNLEQAILEKTILLKRGKLV
jgi:hypothetical protein